MLNVNRILIFLTIAIFSSSVYAVDISNFDIKGIKLGMSKSEVLKRMPCKKPKIKKYYIDTIKGKKLSEISIACEKNSETLDVSLSRKGLVYFVSRKKDFNISPLWSKIKKQVINHYGSPICESPNHYDSIPISNIAWGGCKIRKHNGTIETFNKSLEFYANEVKNSFSHMIFNLWDHDLDDYNRKWYLEQVKLYEKYKKEKASNIDF